MCRNRVWRLPSARDALLFTLFDDVSARAADLSDDEIMELAIQAQREARAERRGREQQAGA